LPYRFLIVDGKMPSPEMIQKDIDKAQARTKELVGKEGKEEEVKRIDDSIKRMEKERDYAKGMQARLDQAREILMARKKAGENLGFDPSDLPDKVRWLNMTAGQITQYAAHPRLDLFVDANSPHSMEKFGCTICHQGQGSADTGDLGHRFYTPNGSRTTGTFPGSDVPLELSREGGLPFLPIGRFARRFARVIPPTDIFPTRARAGREPRSCPERTALSFAVDWRSQVDQGSGAPKLTRVGLLAQTLTSMFSSKARPVSVQLALSWQV